jgi:cold shock CspA family protein
MTRDSTRSKLKGTIKALKKAEGYGFVTHSATGTDYFFHRSELRDSPIPFESLKLDQPVEFTPVEGPKGMRAQEIVVLDR